uniref:Uncharacterized protein n=1 Tax=Globodera rostochiensis TaxID=31243 RepID=A0A914HPM3_GLORO
MENVGNVSKHLLLYFSFFQPIRLTCTEFILFLMAPPPPPKGNAHSSGKENSDEQQQESEVPEWAQNDVEHPVLKVFGFQPNRLGREWPPNPAQPEDIQLGHANKHKTLGDLDWLAGPAEAVPVREQVPLRGKLNAQWPPPEKEYRVELLLPEGVKQ